MTNPSYTHADLEMVAFLASRSIATVLEERPITSINTIINERYDRETDEHLRYLRNRTERRTA